MTWTMDHINFLRLAWLKMMKLNLGLPDVQYKKKKKVAHPAQSNFFVHKSSLHCIFLKSLGLEILLSSFEQNRFLGQKM